MIRLLLAILLTIDLATVAVAQSEVPGAAFSGFRAYWLQKRDGCQPMVSFTVRNTSAADLGAIEFQMVVTDKDKDAVFANGQASLPEGKLSPGHTEDIALGGNHDITAHECLGDMHETAFSSIHFVVQVSAKVAQDASSIEIVRDKPMTEELVPARD